MKPKVPKKHSLAVAWEKWLYSIEGEGCALGKPSGVYLQNRLHRAFMAGVEAADRIARGKGKK